MSPCLVFCSHRQQASSPLITQRVIEAARRAAALASQQAAIATTWEQSWQAPVSQPGPPPPVPYPATAPLTAVAAPVTAPTNAAVSGSTPIAAPSAAISGKGRAVEQEPSLTSPRRAAASGAPFVVPMVPLQSLHAQLYPDHNGRPHSGSGTIQVMAPPAHVVPPVLPPQSSDGTAATTVTRGRGGTSDYPSGSRESSGSNAGGTRAGNASGHSAQTRTAQMTVMGQYPLVSPLAVGRPDMLVFDVGGNGGSAIPLSPVPHLHDGSSSNMAASGGSDALPFNLSIDTSHWPVDDTPALHPGSDPTPRAQADERKPAFLTRVAASAGVANGAVDVPPRGPSTSAASPGDASSATSSLVSGVQRVVSTSPASDSASHVDSRSSLPAFTTGLHVPTADTASVNSPSARSLSTSRSSATPSGSVPFPASVVATAPLLQRRGRPGGYSSG